MDKYEALKTYFGYDSFRAGQERLVDAVLSGRDVLGIMPTGGGKSLCYQIPAVISDGVCVVISPLISLMKDQVRALSECGVRAAFINSTLSGDEYLEVYDRASRGEYKILYLAPERLDTRSAKTLSERLKITLVAVDEAHCISQWGQDFRPSYLHIADFIASLPARPVVAAFTATATHEVRLDIVRLLGLRNPLCEVTGFDRPNLFFDVLKPLNKRETLYNLISGRRGESGIVYCSTRKTTESVCSFLRGHGVNAACYHAGLPQEERKKAQEDFVFDRVNVMVATNAFGMGIDKSNVSFVIHYNMPKSVEAYYQEAGRAGRDGRSANCILLYSPQDAATARYLIEHGGNDELSGEESEAVKEKNYERLRAMKRYSTTAGCFRAYILRYFGQATDGRPCGNCGNCGRAQSETHKEPYGAGVTENQQAAKQREESAGGASPTAMKKDVTRAAQIAISCVARIKQLKGFYVGETLVVRTLRGSKDKRVLELGLDGISTYGLMKSIPASRVRALIDALCDESYLAIESEYKTLCLTKKSLDVIASREKVYLAVPRESPGRKMGAAQPGAHAGLYDALREIRLKLSESRHIPPYMIFPNASLYDMAEKEPSTIDEFLEVPGVGGVKARLYGKVFLEAISAYKAGHET